MMSGKGRYKEETTSGPSEASLTEEETMTWREYKEQKGKTKLELRDMKMRDMKDTKEGEADFFALKVDRGYLPAHLLSLFHFGGKCTRTHTHTHALTWRVLLLWKGKKAKPSGKGDRDRDQVGSCFHTPAKGTCTWLLNCLAPTLRWFISVFFVAVAPGVIERLSILSLFVLAVDNSM